MVAHITARSVGTALVGGNLRWPKSSLAHGPTDRFPRAAMRPSSDTGLIDNPQGPLPTHLSRQERTCTQNP